MSDISTQTAQDVSPPPVETTIPDQAPVGGSGEVGQQTPQKSMEQVQAERAIERRASLERALNKAKEQAATRAEDKSEDEVEEKPVKSQGKPVDVPGKSQQQERHSQRGERGRFASAQPASDATDAGQPAAQQVRYAPLAADAPYRDAPGRFSDAAKADWHGAPESVRAATTQAFQQYEQGIQQYRQAAEAYQPLSRHDQIARQQGLHLPQVLDNYIAMEDRLRGDVFGGLDLIVHNLNMTHPDGRRVSFGDVARAYLNMSPEQHRLTQQQNYAQAQHHQLNQLQQAYQGLAANFQQMQYRQNHSAALDAINQFADRHPGFDERIAIIKEEMDHGYPLDVAYHRAIALRPGNGSTQAAQTRTHSAQTRDEIDRSISGAPTNGIASPRASKPSKSNGEALRNALRRVRSGV